jgi:proline racemase
MQVKRKPFSIGYVSKLTGVKVSTLRSWERYGLLAPTRSDGRHRNFDEGDLRRVQEVLRLRRVYGYNLTAIKHELARSSTDQTQPSLASRSANGPGDPIGARVRSLRNNARLSVRDLARSAGLAASYVSMFERGKAYPSPARLNAIARTLGVTLGDLLGSTETGGRPIIRRGSGRIVESFGPGVSIEQLTVGEQLMDCEIWTLQPGAESEGSYSHSGQELVHVLSGQFEIGLEESDSQILEVGDSAYFESSRRHRWRNPGEVPAVVLWVNTDPDRLTALEPAAQPHQIVIGSPAIKDPGEPMALSLNPGAKTYRVVDTHTAGHPTRLILDPLELNGETVREKRDDFRRRLDHLRPQLLHEPRGHAATFGLVPTDSVTADFGAIFISSYKYLDMCGHGTIGYSRALAALGRLGDRSNFTLEVPAGIVTVKLGLHGSSNNVTIENVPCWVALPNLDLSGVEPGLLVTIAYGGCWYANVSAAALDLAVTPDNVSRLMALGARIKEAVNAILARQAGAPREIDSVLFYEDVVHRRSRQLVVLESNKYDRSPCGTGLSARLAQLVVEGALKAGDALEVENVFGVPFLGRVLEETTVGKWPAVVPEITGQAHVSGLSTLIIEPDDPLPNGFLCR